MLSNYHTDDLLAVMFMQYMKHRMEITQELWEYYALTTNSVKTLREVYATNGFITVRR